MPSFVGGRGAAGAGKTKLVIAMILIAVFLTVMNLHATIKHGKEFNDFSPSDMLILDTTNGDGNGDGNGGTNNATLVSKTDEDGESVTNMNNNNNQNAEDESNYHDDVGNENQDMNNDDTNENHQNESNEESTTNESTISTTSFNTHKAPTEQDYRHETNVFQNMLNRVKSAKQTCQSLDPIDATPPKKDFDTGIAPLPPHGLEHVLQSWLDSQDYSKRAGYPMCRLPPTKSCNTTDYSLIIMAHKVSDAKRLKIMYNGIKSFATYKSTAEIILVWNSDRSVLTETNNGQVKDILKWANDPSHPLRIFYSLENGLENNLFNRYHPNINPSQELLMYFDDDGPFFSEEAMEAGIRLWQYNSDTQVGCFARNLRFKSQRMNAIQKETSNVAIEQLLSNSWQVDVNPNDLSTIQKMSSSGEGSIDTTTQQHPPFTPLCPATQNDRIEYNFFVFPDFTAHMFLPSGTLIHRDFLCFVWHPVFEQIRQYILDHPTHPDDMVMSTLLSHLSGKGLRSFPRIIKEKKKEKEVSNEVANEKKDKDAIESKGKEKVKEPPKESQKKEEDDDDDTQESKQTHRRLLWQQENWADMREEAINSVIGYFGTVNPGSIGWCVGTDYQVKNRATIFECKPNFPMGVDEIPWMQESGLGYDKCER